MSAGMAFLYAAGAGFAVSILDYSSLASTPKVDRPGRFNDPAYLAKFFGHPFIGGFLALVLNQEIENFTVGMAVIAGAAAPGIWRAIVRSGAALFRVFAQELGSSNPEV